MTIIRATPCRTHPRAGGQSSYSLRTLVEHALNMTTGFSTRPLRLAAGGRPIDAIAFNRTERLPATVRAVYRLAVNEFNGQRTAQLVVEHCAPA